MDSSELEKLARRVTVVPPRGAEAPPVVVFERRPKRRKGNKAFRSLERLVRRTMRAERAYADTYLRAHDKSNTKKKDGWMRDGFYNNLRAGRRAMKVMLGLFF